MESIGGKNWTLYIGDCRVAMREQIAPKSVHCITSSPPYWGLRDYGIAPVKWADGTEAVFGLEPTVEAYVRHTLEIFDGLRRVLRDDGVIWWNIGDTYGGQRGNKSPAPDNKNRHEAADTPGHAKAGTDKASKLLVPHRVAIAIQDAGWCVRQDVVWCLSGGSWLYAKTQKGEMSAMLKDLVRLKPETVQLWNGRKWTRVVSWTESMYASSRIELVLRSGERIGCTGQHVWPTDRGDVRAIELRVGDVIRTCRLPEPENAESPDALDDDTLWFLGLYLAEGTRHEKPGSADSLSLALHADEKSWIPRLESVARRFAGSLTFADRGENGLSVRLYGRILVAVVEQYISGRTSLDKRFSAAVWSLPNHALRHIACGYLDGDGHRDEKNRRWRLGFCRNYALERDLRTLAARLGARLTLKPGFAKYQGGLKPSFRGEWRWSVDESARIDPGELVEIRASRARKFWDVEVEDEPHLFALASGVLTHNSKRSPMPESVSGWRWRRCRVKVEAAKRPRQCMHHSEGREISTPISSQPHTVWEPCPGCEKCRETGGYVLRRGSWRPTNSHEFIFQIAKSDCYFADGDAVAETATGGVPGNRTHKQKTAYDAGDRMHRRAAGLCEMGASEKRNPRSVHPSEWTAEDIEWAIRFMNAMPKDGSVWTLSNEPFKGAHFATFPTSIPRRCITAATSAGGCCPECGSQYAPIVDSSRVATRPGVDSKCYKHEGGADPTAESLGWDQPNVIGNRDPKRHSTVNTVQGYRATCECNAGDPVPPTVFDPFNGSGTTGQVALDLGCRYIGCEINPKYAREIAAIRIETPLRQPGSPPPKKPAKFQTPSLFK